MAENSIAVHNSSALRIDGAIRSKTNYSRAYYVKIATTISYVLKTQNITSQQPKFH